MFQRLGGVYIVKSNVQDINLLSCLPKEKVIRPTFNEMLVLLFITGLVLAFVSMLQGASLKQKSHEIKQLQVQLATKKEVFMNKHRHREGKKLVAVLDAHYKPFLKGFHNSLQQLTKGPVAQAWLTRIAIDREANGILFHGEANNAHAVYEFIDSLKGLDIYSGQVFNLLSLVKETDRKIKTIKKKGRRVAGSNMVAGKNVSTVLHFVLSSTQADFMKKKKTRRRAQGAQPKGFDREKQRLAMKNTMFGG
jgi:hypothetical protein